MLMNFTNYLPTEINIEPYFLTMNLGNNVAELLIVFDNFFQCIASFTIDID